MFFVINPQNRAQVGFALTSYLEPADDIYVLDTEDLVVEKVSFSYLYNILSTELKYEFRGVHIDGDFIEVIYTVSFTDYLKGWGYLICNKEKVVYTGKGVLLINGIDIGLQVEQSDELIYISVNGECACVYQEKGDSVRSGVAYVFRLSDYYIVRYIYQCNMWSVISTVFILDMGGLLIDVIPDRRYKNQVGVESKNPRFTSKYIALHIEKY